jgi:hypothetical protein
MSRDVDNRDQFELNGYLQERVDFLKGQIEFYQIYIRNLEGLVAAKEKTICDLLEERRTRI